MTTKSKKSESVKVVVRCRPLNKKEISENYESIVKMNVKMGQVEIRNPKSQLLKKTLGNFKNLV